MNLCEDGHDEICYEGNRCPFCDAKSDWKTTLEQHDDEVKALTEQITSLEDEIESMRERVVLAVKIANEQSNEP